MEPKFVSIGILILICLLSLHVVAEEITEEFMLKEVVRKMEMLQDEITDVYAVATLLLNDTLQAKTLNQDN